MENLVPATEKQLRDAGRNYKSLLKQHIWKAGNQIGFPVF